MAAATLICMSQKQKKTTTTQNFVNFVLVFFEHFNLHCFFHCGRGQAARTQRATLHRQSVNMARKFFLLVLLLRVIYRTMKSAEQIRTMLPKQSGGNENMLQTRSKAFWGNVYAAA